MGYLKHEHTNTEPQVSKSISNSQYISTYWTYLDMFGNWIYSWILVVLYLCVHALDIVLKSLYWCMYTSSSWKLIRSRGSFGERGEESINIAIKRYQHIY